METATQQKTVETEVKSRHQIPDNEEIDTLLGLYLDAKQNVQNAIEKRDVFGEQIEEMIALHGFLPPKAKKSKRIQGDEYKGTLSQSHSVEVDSTAVQRFHATLKQFGLSRYFRKIFRREQIFVLVDGAQAFVSKFTLALQQEREPVQASELQLLFAQTLKVESRSSYLEVEPLKKEGKK